MSVDVRELLRLCDLPQLVGCIAQSVDRPVLEAEIRRIAKGAVDMQARSREELAHALVSFCEKDKQVRRALGNAIEQATTLERQKLETFPADGFSEALAPYLTQRRAGAKFMLAMIVLAAERGDPWLARVGGVLSEQKAARDKSVVTMKKAEQAGIADDVRELAEAFAETQRAKGSLEEKVLTLEHERGQILARLGQHEVELKRMHETSRALERELQQAKRQAPAPQPMEDDEVTSLKRKLRRVEKQAAFVRDRERDRDHLKLIEAERDALAKENAVLRAQLHVALVTRASSPHPELAALARPSPAERERVAKPSEDLTGIFVDGANLAGAARHLHGRKIDFGALQQLLVARGEHAICTAYVIDNGAAGFEPFMRALKASGYKVRKRAPKILPDGSQKADQDVEIAVDVMAELHRLSRVVLVSGDSDFLPLIRAIKKAGVRVEAAMFRARVAHELVTEVDAFIPLGDTILV